MTFLGTPVPYVYTNASVTTPPTRQLPYQICPEKGAPVEEASLVVGQVDGPSCLSRWREMPSLEKQSIDLSRLC